MKNYRRNHQEESALLQEIIRTYRYPDGTLNRIAVFISTLALVLLLLLGHFTVLGIKNIKSMNSVSAAELTLEEIEDYITSSYLDAIDEYTKGDLDEEAAKRQILNHIAEYLSSSSAFTEEQKTEILEQVSNYISELQLSEKDDANSKAIEDINNLFASYMNSNAEELANLKAALEAAIANNQNYTEDELKSLKELNDKLSALELSHFGSLNEIIEATKNEIANTQYDVKDLGNRADGTDADMKDLQNRVEVLEDKTTAEDSQDFYFTYDSSSGSYGYKVNGQFKPW